MDINDKEFFALTPVIADRADVSIVPVLRCRTKK